MAWSVHARQIRLAALLARRQFIVTGEAGEPGMAAHAANGHDSAGPNGHGGAPANGHSGTPANGHGGPVPAP